MNYVKSLRPRLQKGELMPAEWWTITQQADPYREDQTQINGLKGYRYATVENRNSPKIKNLIYETYKPFSVYN